MSQIRTQPLSVLITRLLVARQVVFTLVIGIVLVLATIWNGQAQVDRQWRLTSAIAQRVDDWVEDATRDTLALAAALPSVRNLDGIREAHRDFEVVYLIGEDGRLIGMSPANPRFPLGMDMSSQPFVSDSTSAATISRPFVSPRTGNLTVYVRVPAVEGRGTVVGELSLTKLEDMVVRADSGRSDRLFIVDRDGYLLAHSNVDLVRQQTEIRGATSFDRAQAGATRMLEIAEDTLVLTTVDSILPTGWMVFSQRSAESVFGPFLLPSLLGLLAVSIINGIVVWRQQVDFAMRVVAPLQRLSHGAQRVASGSRDETLAAGPEHSEFAEVVSLADSLERMVASLGEREADLEESEARYRDLFHDSPVSLWEEDFSAVKLRLDELKRHGVVDFREYFAAHADAVRECASLIRLIDVNRATVELCRAANRDEVIAGFTGLLVHDQDAAIVQELVAIAEGRSELTVNTVVLTLEGERRDSILGWRVAPGARETLSRVIVSVSDVTERERAAREIATYVQQLETLQEIDRAILAAESMDAVAREALARLQRIVPCSMAGVTMYGQRTTVLEDSTLAGGTVQDRTSNGASRPAIGDLTGVVLALVTDDPALIAPGSRVGPWGSVVPPVDDACRTGDLWNERDLSPNARLLVDCGVRSYVSLPLRIGGEIVGALFLGDDEPDTFTTGHVEIARGVATQIAVAIEQARLRDSLRLHADELEKRVRERTRQLEEVNAELSAFAYSVSHDLRAPLRAQQGYSQILLEDHAGQLDAEGRSFVERIHDAANRMEVLIGDILAFSRVSRVEFESRPLDLEQIVGEALKQVDSQVAGRDARVEVRRPLSTALGHRTALVQVVANLVSNATKFVATDRRPHVRVFTEARGDVTRLWVCDNGIGIALENQDRIFAAFERLHGVEEYPGSGIGLAIVRKGVERMGGTVGVESELGSGSRFWVDLPRGD